MDRLLLLFTLLTCGYSGIYAKTVTVSQDGSGDFGEIWNAIAAAEPGDTVDVKAGHYGGRLFIDKSLTIREATTIHPRISKRACMSGKA